jgi:hypothetical protein
MQRILEQVNNAPNSSLRKVLGFDVSPAMAHNDYQLQQEIQRRYTVWNQLVYESPGFMIPIGALVQIYNENSSYMKRRELVKPHIYTVLQFNGAHFIVRNTTVGQEHEVRHVPRWRLKLYRKRSDAKIS